MKLPEKANKIGILPRFQRWMKKTIILRARFSIILKIWKHFGIGRNTNKKTATDLNTLLLYMEANGMKNEETESLPCGARVSKSVCLQHFKTNRNGCAVNSSCLQVSVYVACFYVLISVTSVTPSQLLQLGFNRKKGCLCP